MSQEDFVIASWHWNWSITWRWLLWWWPSFGISHPFGTWYFKVQDNMPLRKNKNRAR